MKKIVVIHFDTNADDNLQAVFNLNKALRQLPDNDLRRFEAVEVLDAE